MKEKIITIIKNNIFGFILGIAFAGLTTTVFADALLTSSEVTYSDSTVKEALDTLYEGASSSSGTNVECGSDTYYDSSLNSCVKN